MKSLLLRHGHRPQSIHDLNALARKTGQTDIALARTIHSLNGQTDRQNKGHYSNAEATSANDVVHSITRLSRTIGILLQELPYWKTVRTEMQDFHHTLMRLFEARSGQMPQDGTPNERQIIATLRDSREPLLAEGRTLLVAWKHAHENPQPEQDNGSPSF